MISLGDDIQYALDWRKSPICGKTIIRDMGLSTSCKWHCNNGTSNDITIDGSSNLYIAGSFKNQLIFHISMTLK